MTHILSQHSRRTPSLALAALSLLALAGSRPVLAQTIIGATSASPAAADLTTLRTLDWVLPTFSSTVAGTPVSYERSLTGLNQIRPFTCTQGYLGGPGTPTGPTTFSWVNGTPLLVGSSAKGVSTGAEFGTGDGFSFTTPADTLARTLTVYVGTYNAEGTLTATLYGTGAAGTAVAGFSATYSAN